MVLRVPSFQREVVLSLVEVVDRHGPSYPVAYQEVIPFQEEEPYQEVDVVECLEVGEVAVVQLRRVPLPFLAPSFEVKVLQRHVLVLVNLQGLLLEVQLAYLDLQRVQDLVQEWLQELELVEALHQGVVGPQQ